MNKLFFIFFAFPCICNAQFFDINLTSSDWNVGETKTLYENTILRVQGINDNYRVTNIGYQSLKQIKTAVIKKAENEMWEDSRKNTSLLTYDKSSIGGVLHLFLKRLTIESANTNKFTIIIKDSTGKEVYREQLEDHIPKVPNDKDDLWFNFEVVNIPKKLEGIIDIYVIDSLGGESSRYKFQIKI